jgi:hypothetical protein
VSLSAALDDRYGAARPGRRRLLLAVVAVVVVAFLGWLAWATWTQATPQVESDLSSFTVVDDHAVDARVEVDLEEGVEASCVIAALAADHQTVGQLTWVPDDGLNDVRIRTERAATAVRLVGCTGPDQPRPR